MRVAVLGGGLQGCCAALALAERAVLERSRIRRVVYDVRQRSQLGRLIYPRSQMRRVMYQIRYLLERLRYKMTRLA